jgi:multidrug efflux pump subunit AcrA (membrane-fusion protein)
MEARVQKAYEAVNLLGSTNQITITPAYMDLKLQELRVEYELQQKMYEEREEQKRIKQQMREEERAQAEIEKAQKDAEDEATRYQKALQKAQEDMSHATGKELDKLNSKIAELEASLKTAEEKKERAMSRAQMTRSGHVYVISNIGSFGEHVYKIGMTRRLEPMDRVKELSDASVPFDFDVHAMIFSDDAPGLERQFHVKFNAHRLNLLNEKREFFRIGIHEIEHVATEMNLEVTITKLAEAREFRASEAMRKNNGILNVGKPQLEPSKSTMELA